MRIGYFTNRPEQGITAGTAVIRDSLFSRSLSTKPFLNIVRELDQLEVTIWPGQHCKVIALPDIGAEVDAHHRRSNGSISVRPPQRARKGVVLAHDDPAAWEGSIAFSCRPTVGAIRSHLVRCYSEGLLWDDVPVLWHFDDGPRVFWERASSLIRDDFVMADWLMQFAGTNRIAA